MLQKKCYSSHLFFLYFTDSHCHLGSGPLNQEEIEIENDDVFVENDGELNVEVDSIFFVGTEKDVYGEENDGEDDGEDDGYLYHFPLEPGQSLFENDDFDGRRDDGFSKEDGDGKRRSIVLQNIVMDDALLWSPISMK